MKTIEQVWEKIKLMHDRNEQEILDSKELTMDSLIQKAELLGKARTLNELMRFLNESDEDPFEPKDYPAKFISEEEQQTK